MFSALTVPTKVDGQSSVSRRLLLFVPISRTLVIVTVGANINFNGNDDDLHFYG